MEWNFRNEILIGWLECYDQKYIAYFLNIYFCGIEYLLIQFFTAENWKCLLWENLHCYFLICFAGTGKRKRLNILYSQHKKWSQIMSWHKNDKNNAVWYLSFLLNKIEIVNKRVSLSSIFLQCFVMKHWEMLAVFVHVHAQVCVEVDESAQPVQICAQTGNPVISVAKKGWFADEHRNLLTGLLY